MKWMIKLVPCGILKIISTIFTKSSECKDCNIKRNVKRNFDRRDKISIQQKIKYERNRINILQKQNDYRN